MPLFHLILVALIQGITEFLPISSSGHLILLPGLTGMADQGQLIDVAVHVGSLGAVVIYFWSDVRLGVTGIPRLLSGRIDTPGARLAFLLVLATIPVVLIGAVFKFTGLSDQLRMIEVIGWAMLIFGLALYWADQRGATDKTGDSWSVKDALIMGLWQAVALIPGTSRSGVVITVARQLGYNRGEAARLAMLMSIPTIVVSGVLLGTDMVIEANPAVIRDTAIATVFAFVSAFMALIFMMRLLRTVSFTPYVIYRVVFGVALLAYAYS